MSTFTNKKWYHNPPKLFIIDEHSPFIKAKHKKILHEYIVFYDMTYFHAKKPFSRHLKDGKKRKKKISFPFEWAWKYFWVGNITHSHINSLFMPTHIFLQSYFHQHRAIYIHINHTKGMRGGEGNWRLTESNPHVKIPPCVYVAISNFTSHNNRKSFFFPNAFFNMPFVPFFSFVADARRQ